MLKRAHLGLSIALLFCFPISNAEAGMYKCTDGNQITYTNEPCEKLGLNSAGPIKNAVTVMPAVTKRREEPSEMPDKEHGEDNDVSGEKAAGNDESGADVSKAATIKPATPKVDKTPEP